MSLQFIAMALAGFAGFGLIWGIFSPAGPNYGGRAQLDKRVRAVKDRRAKLRENRKISKRDKKDLNAGKMRLMRSTVEKFQMQEVLDNTELRMKLIQAGFRSKSAVTTYTFVTIVAPLGLAFLALVWFALISPYPFQPARHSAIAFLIMLIGYYGPRIYVKNKGDNRRKLMSRAYPDALDLMVICVESGMSVEKAFHKVADEIAPQSEDLAQEIGMLTAELSYLGDRTQAYENFAGRTGINAIRSLVSALVQAERYGTPVGQALRVIAEESRAERMSMAEQKAASLPAKLTVPMIVFFLPVLFVVIIGPTVIQITSM